MEEMKPYPFFKPFKPLKTKGSLITKPLSQFGSSFGPNKELKALIGKLIPWNKNFGQFNIWGRPWN